MLFYDLFVFLFTAFLFFLNWCSVAAEGRGFVKQLCPAFSPPSYPPAEEKYNWFGIVSFRLF